MSSKKKTGLDDSLGSTTLLEPSHVAFFAKREERGGIPSRAVIHRMDVLVQLGNPPWVIPPERCRAARQAVTSWPIRSSVTRSRTFRLKFSGAIQMQVLFASRRKTCRARFEKAAAPTPGETTFRRIRASGVVEFQSDVVALLPRHGILFHHRVAHSFIQIGRADDCRPVRAHSAEPFRGVRAPGPIAGPQVGRG
jgi:hypothetical protein